METSVSIDNETAEILGDYRTRMVLKNISEMIVQQVSLSQMVAESGAMRWPVGMRPEVMVSISSRLL